VDICLKDLKKPLEIPQTFRYILQIFIVVREFKYRYLKPGAHERNWQRQMAGVTIGAAELLSCARNFPMLLGIPDRRRISMFEFFGQA
jgi:hypothetical protein